MITIKVTTQGNENLDALKPYKKRRKPEQYATPVFSPTRIPRNQKCPCGSGKKFKHCHMEVLRAPPISVVPNPEYTGSPEVVQFSEVSID